MERVGRAPGFPDVGAPPVVRIRPEERSIRSGKGRARLVTLPPLEEGPGLSQDAGLCSCPQTCVPRPCCAHVPSGLTDSRLQVLVDRDPAFLTDSQRSCASRSRGLGWEMCRAATLGRCAVGQRGASGGLPAQLPGLSVSSPVCFLSPQCFRV